MSDEYGREEWQTDSDAAHAEAVRRVKQAIATGAAALDLADLSAMTRLPEELSEAHDLRSIYAGRYSPVGVAVGFLEHKLTDIASLSGLELLASLNLSGTRLTDVSPIAGLRGLRHLSLNLTKISDVAPLADLQSLKSLNLSRTSVIDISPLAGLAILEHLTLENTPVFDATPIGLLRSLVSLDISDTAISDTSAMSHLSALTELSLDNTDISSLTFLLELPRFFEERAAFLAYSGTPATDSDRRLDLLSRLPPDRCATETVQYLKGTHPDFRAPKGGAGVGKGTLAARLEQASPVEVVVEGGLLQVRNAGAPERLAPKELGTRIVALRAQVEAVLDEAKGKQMSEDIVKRFRRYARALQGDEVTYLLLDGPIAALRGGVNDPYITGALDGGFVEMWRALVVMHDDLRPLLLPPEEDDLPELRDDVTVEDGLDLAEQVEGALQAAVEDGVVGASVVEAMQAATEYFKVAKVGAEKKHWLQRGAAAMGGILLGVLSVPAGLGMYADAALKVPEFLTTSAGQALITALRPLWEALKAFFA